VVTIDLRQRNAISHSLGKLRCELQREVRDLTRFFSARPAVLQGERTVELRRLGRVGTSGLWHGKSDALALGKLQRAVRRDVRDETSYY